eukprot:587631-Pyramimonas_sp.AAC.1
MYAASRPAKDENTDEAKERLEWAVGERRSMPATMADVADEGMRSTRMLGNDDVGTASLNSEMPLFSRRIDALFGESKRR